MILSRRILLQFLGITSTTMFMNPLNKIEVPKLWVPAKNFLGGCDACKDSFKKYPNLDKYLTDAILQKHCIAGDEKYLNSHGLDGDAIIHAYIYDGLL